MKKRVLSLFMAFTLCFSMQPTVAFAGETGVVTEQEVPSSENTTEVYTADSISDGDVSGGDAGVQDAEDAAVRAAQELIDALPDEVTAENAEMIGGQLAAIDEALAALTDEQRAELDMTRYDAICAALTAFVAVQDGEHIHPVCGDKDCSEHGANVQWTAIGTADDLKAVQAGTADAPQYYYLLNDVTLEEEWTPAESVVLCLNGYSIILDYQGTGISVNGNFTLCDCGDSGKIKHTEESSGSILRRGHAVVVNANGTFTMYGGIITENLMIAGTKYRGIGVSVEKNGTFKMHGGKITGNRTEYVGYGAGVYVAGTFIMTGGEITDNTVLLEEKGSQIDPSAGLGGGVYVDTSAGGKVFVSGDAKIYDNWQEVKGEDTKTANNVYLTSSGSENITVDAALSGNAKIGVIMKQDLAEGEYAAIAKGASDDYTLTADDLAAFSSDTGYTKYELDNAVIFSNGELHVHGECGTAGCTHTLHEDVQWKAVGTEAELRAITGGTDTQYYYLTNNIELNDTSWNPTGRIALCLNGYSIIANDNFDTITVNDGTDSAASLTLCDCNGSGNNKGEITHANGMKGRGVYVTTDGWFYQYGGNITGNSTSDNGGGVYLDGSFFYMYGGSITDNSANNGGGVAGRVSNYKVDGGYVIGNLLMLGGTITGNKATANGGGVAMDCTFEMRGGSIANNEAGDNGGGVAVIAAYTAQWSGGSVTGNTAQNNGGGVYVDSNAKAMKVGGDVNITGNTNGNVYLPAGKTITVGATIGYNVKDLTDVASIGVTTSGTPTAEAPIKIATGATGSVNYTKIFKPDNTDSGYLVTKDEQGNLYLSAHQHSWKYTLGTDGKTITATCVNTTNCPDTDGGSVTIKAPGENTLTYDGSKKTATLENNLLTGENNPTISYTLGSGQGNNLPEGSYPTNVGTYTASITVGGVIASVTYEIKKADPAAKDFVFTAPDDLTYDGNAKTAEVKAATNITGMGDVTVKYYQGETEVQPVNAGEYTVKISVMDGTNYNAASGLTDASWAFTIAPIKTTPTVELSGNMTYTGKQITPDVTVTIDGKTLTKGTDYTITYGDNVNAGTDAGSVTVKAMGNYGFTDFVKNFTIEKADPELNFEKDAVTKTYSDRSQPFTNSITRKGDGKVTYSSKDTTVATVDEDTGKVTIVSVGTAVITATVAATENYEEGSTSYTLTVNKARLVVNGVITAKDKTYDGTTDADVEVSFADENNALLYLKPDKDYTVRGTFSSPNASDSAQTVKVEITLMGDCAEKYTLETDTYKAYAYINAKPISIANVLPQNRSYKWNDTSVTIMGVTFNDSTNTPVTTLRNGLDYTVSGKMADANIGTNKEVAVTVTLQGNAANNYSLASNMTTATVTITKAAGGALTKDNRQQKFSDRRKKTLTPDYTGLPADETWKYSISGALASGTAEVEPATIDSATGEITYTLINGAENDTISWTVTISNPNYEDFTKDLVLTLTAKDPQETLRITGDDTVVYGEKLKLSTVGGSGTGEITYSVDASSTGEATIGADGVLTPVTVGSVVIIATKAGDADYSEITSAPFVIMITPATPSGEPKYNKITTGGKTLAEAGLTLDGSTLTPADGTLVWVDDKGIELPGETEVEVNKTYKWRFTPANTNYKSLTGEIELYHVDAPAVTAQPKSVSVITGERAVFEVAATGTDVTYQWKIDRNDGNGFVDITGANSASYTSGVTDKDCDGFKYQCVISNAAGSVTTDTVVLTVKEKYIFTATAGEHGSISPNGDVEVVEGSSRTFVITPEEGYEIDSLTVDGNAVSAVTSYTFENVTAAHTIAVTFKIQYRIIDGADSSWTQNTDGSLIIRGNGAFSKFLNVKVDGQAIDPVNYTVREGSTIVELKADYLKTLPEGSHTFELEWTDGSASTHFTVARNTSGGNNNNSNNSNTNNNSIQSKDNSNTAEKAKDPGTGDASHNVFWYLLTAMSAVGLAVIAFLRNRKKE